MPSRSCRCSPKRCARSKPRAEPQGPPGPSGPLDDLAAELRTLVGRELRTQSAPLASQVLPGLVAELEHDDALRKGVCEHLRSSHEQARAALGRAVERGEVAQLEDADLLNDAIAGTLFWRKFVTGQGCDPEFVERLVAFFGRSVR